MLFPAALRFLFWAGRTWSEGGPIGAVERTRTVALTVVALEEGLALRTGRSRGERLPD
jgi:hypothetical protein